MTDIESHEHADDEDGDPFDVFGVSDSDDDKDADNSADASSNGGDKQVSGTAARSLVDQANAKMRSNPCSNERRMSNSLSEEEPVNATAANQGCGNNTEPTSVADLKSALQSQWPDRPALYLGPMAAYPVAMGGGRGYIATQNLKPGTLLLAEVPIWTWPLEQQRRELSLVSILNIIRCDDAARIVRDMELLHPTMAAVDNYLDCRKNNNSAFNDDDSKSMSGSNIDQIDKMMAKMESKYSESVMLQDILDVSRRRNITRSDNKMVISTDVYRMLLALRYNGFETGLYLHFAIFNHGEIPNCLKFSPRQCGGNTTDDNGFECCSEIRTTRFVKRGEPLTISYLNPREVSHATRRQHLWDQHLFDIGDDVDSSTIRQFELVHGAIPKSSKKRRYDDTTYRIESVVSELEEQMDEINNAFSAGNFVPEKVERAKVIEVAASSEVISSALQQLGNANHFLMVRCYRLHLDAAETLLNADVAAGLTNSQKNNIMCRFIETARKLLDLQILYLGKHHVDVGRTYQDLSQGINTMLSRSPRKLLNLKLDGMKNFAQCSEEDHRCQREYERIRALYVDNAVEIEVRKK